MGLNPHGTPIIEVGALTWRQQVNDGFLLLDSGRITLRDILTNLPAAGTVDRFYFATDVQAIFYDDGTDWILVSSNRLRAVSTSPVTLDNSDRVVDVDASGGARTVNLPAATAAKGSIITIKKNEASGNAVTVTPNGGDTIDETVSLTSDNDKVTLISDGTSKWIVIG